MLVTMVWMVVNLTGGKQAMAVSKTGVRIKQRLTFPSQIIHAGRYLGCV
jgi:hypothetical protein